VLSPLLLKGRCVRYGTVLSRRENEEFEFARNMRWFWHQSREAWPRASSLISNQRR